MNKLLIEGERTMVKHIVMFAFKDEFPQSERKAKLAEIKEITEALTGVVPGLLETTVYIDPIESSTHSFMLEAILEDVDSLNGYQIHPAHVAVGTVIKAVAHNRACFDRML